MRTERCFLFCLLITLSLASYGQDDMEIYKQVINEFVLKNDRPPNAQGSRTLIMLEKPAHMKKIVDADYEYFKRKYKKLDRETFIDFVKKNQAESEIQTLKIDFAEIVRIKRESLNWDEFTRSYPNWNHSILEFSNVGFNGLRNQAIIYYSFDSGPGVGGGVYVIYKKRGKKWKNRKVIPAWAS
jgi:hypothetical protein